MHRVLGPELRPGRLEPLAGRVGRISPTRRASASQSGGHRGQRLEGVADGAGEDRVVLDPFQVSLVERPLLGLAERLDAHALPERPQPENRLQAVRLADAGHRAAATGSELPLGPGHADGLGHRRDGPAGRSSVRRPLLDPGWRSRRSAGRSGAASRASKPTLEQLEDDGPRLDAQGRQGVAQARERPDRRLGQREEAQGQARSDAQARPEAAATTAGESSCSVSSAARVLGRAASLSRSREPGRSPRAWRSDTAPARSGRPAGDRSARRRPRQATVGGPAGSELEVGKTAIRAFPQRTIRGV